MKAETSKFTTKQRVFIEEYLCCWNATEAARRAGYAEPNKQGPRMLVNVGISQEIEVRISEAAMTANEVLLRLAQQARGEHAYFWKVENGNLRFDLEGLVNAGKGHLIKKLRFGNNGKPVEIEFHDAQAALALIGRYHKLFVDRIEQDISGLLQIEKKASELSDDELATIAARGR